GPRTLEDLAARLVEGGERFFSDDEVDFLTEFRDVWPDAHLSLPVRRNVLLIGLEAMHNVTRHSGARRVVLRLAPRGRWWELEVQDDGIGLPATALEEEDAGLGLASMRRRAEEIGAQIEWGAPPAGGTKVMLRFALRGGSRQGWFRRSHEYAGPSGRRDR
ncbi:MAG: ATP-binding protein, partial [Gemmatimonadota bacterium]